MDNRKKILAFGIDADGVVFNTAFDQAVSKLPNSLTWPQKQKMILDQQIAITSNDALLNWIEGLIECEAPDAVYFISFSNRQDICIDFGNRELKKNSLFMPVLDQLVQVISDRVQKKHQEKKSMPRIQLLKSLLADLYPDSTIKIKKENNEELKSLNLKRWNIKNRNSAFDSGKLNIFIFMMNLIYDRASSDFLGESFQIHYHVIDDVAMIIQPLYQAIQSHPAFVIQETGASFFLFNKDQSIQLLGSVQGVGQFDVNYETHLPELFEMAFSSRVDMQLNSVNILDKNMVSVMTDQSSRYQLSHYLEYIKRDNEAVPSSKNQLMLSILESLEKASNRLQTIQSLVEKDAEIFKKRVDETGDTLLILFMKKGWFEEAEYLVKLGADISMENKFGLGAKDFLPKPSLLQALSCAWQQEDKIKKEKQETKQEIKYSQSETDIQIDAIKVSEKTASVTSKLKRANAFLDGEEYLQMAQSSSSSSSSSISSSRGSVLGKRKRDEWGADEDLVYEEEKVKKAGKGSHEYSQAKKSRACVAGQENSTSFFSASVKKISIEKMQSEKSETTLSFATQSKSSSE